MVGKIEMFEGIRKRRIRSKNPGGVSFAVHGNNSPDLRSPHHGQGNRNYRQRNSLVFVDFRLPLKELQPVEET
jgi:hypothetical protein